MSESRQKVLVLGKGGQLASSLRVVLGNRAQFAGRDHADLLNLNQLQKFLFSEKPDVLINTAAYTQVDKAESEKEAAKTINADAVKVMAEFCKENKGLLIHFSTDYVYSGTGTQEWKESDEPHPTNVYGMTKLAGEQLIRDSGCEHFIFRTSWLYSSTGQNFLKTMLKLGSERSELKIVADQVGAPTNTDDLAVAINKLLEARSAGAQLPSGTYNLASSGTTSWYGFAMEIFREARKQSWPLKIEKVDPIASSQYPTPAKRPLNSRLSLQKSEGVLGLKLPHWQEAIPQTIQQLKISSYLTP